MEEVIPGKEHVWFGAPQHCLAFTEPAWLQFVFLCTSQLFLLSFFPLSISPPLPLFLPSRLSFLTFLTSLPPSCLLLWFILELQENVIKRTKNLFFTWNKNNVFLQVFVGISIAWHTLCHKSILFTPQMICTSSQCTFLPLGFFGNPQACRPRLWSQAGRFKELFCNPFPFTPHQRMDGGSIGKSE